MNLKKLDTILGIGEDYIIPLAEQGVKMTNNIEDDLAVAFFKGGIKEVRQKLQTLESDTPTNAPAKQ